MTAAERLQAEKERLLTTTGFYVPPYRMANLMKAAAKIMDIIIKADTNICYEECRFIMAIVDAATEVASNHSHGVMQFDSNIAEALKVGDKVVLLRNYGGQEYLILGRL